MTKTKPKQKAKKKLHWASQLMKGCPWCGSLPKLEVLNLESRLSCVNEDCQMNVFTHWDRTDLTVKIWNTRK